ncbi:hypothetical protein SBK02_005016 [Raoultella planticola]|uniref:Uncharacterized protein n=1 Tax=Raoultella planticola TaxID=575 RepID=A0A5P6A9I1_RAOPL|nr:hypothetical protein [Raoultella planticola]ELU1430647.1 hypothetical protein [Raoultella planticola]QFG76579.1 hypothetical protein DMB90_08390 [Raoultella planticola]
MKNENELTALALTIEKCQEIVGCPAGVDLQDRIKQLRGEGGHELYAGAYGLVTNSIATRSKRR